MNAETFPRCEWCDGPIATAQDVIDRRATYADTAGGHADRHALVVEAAEQVIA